MGGWVDLSLSSLSSYLVQAEFLGPFPKDEEHRVDDVGLAGTIGPVYGKVGGWVDRLGR